MSELRIRILGNYSVDHDPWRLIELELWNAPDDFDWGAIALPAPGQPRPNWQVPWDERILEEREADGQKFMRACFFMFVCNEGPLATPVGPVELPSAIPRPDRLSFVKFEDPGY